MNDSDDIDRATEIAQKATDAALEDVRRKAAPEQVRVNGEWPKRECEDCGGEIPVKRLDLGKIRCVHCQHALEVRRAGR